jgi:hypothetical protein
MELFIDAIPDGRIKRLPSAWTSRFPICTMCSHIAHEIHNVFGNQNHCSSHFNSESGELFAYRLRLESDVKRREEPPQGAGFPAAEQSDSPFPHFRVPR